MDGAELKRVKEVVAKAETLTNEVEKLTTAIKVGRQTNAVQFTFSPWGITYQDGDDSRLRVFCGSHLLSDLSLEFREAFLSIVEQRLVERKKQLEELGV